MQTSGIARTDIEVVDLSVLVATGLKGIHAVNGVTEWGEVNKPRLVGSWPEFVRHFGGLRANSQFPWICKRALESGAKLYVNRVGHYSDIADKTTLQGTAASVTDGTNVLTIDAESVGPWGNKVSVDIAAAASGLSGMLDIKISIAGYPTLTQDIRDFPEAHPDDSQITLFNQKYRYAKLSLASYPGVIPTGSLTLTGGAETVANIVDTDYIGSAISQLGLHAFDGINEITKIWVPALAEPTIDTALIAYAVQRKDIIACTRTPVGVDGDIVIDYRMGTGSYSHTAHDSWQGFMFTGGLYAVDPLDGIKKYITEVGDVMGAMSRRDNLLKEWFSFAGPKRGKIFNALGVAFNFGTPARQTAADLIDIKGVNMTIDHPDFGTVIWGNSTLQRNDTLLKHANVAELIIFLIRALRPLVQVDGFDPNDIETWKAIHRRVIPLMDIVKNGRGVWKYKYEGDQDIDDISQAQVNIPENIDAGAYEFRLFVAPKVGMKYIGVKIAVTNSGMDYELLPDTI